MNTDKQLVRARPVRRRISLEKDHVDRLLLPDAARFHHGRVIQNRRYGNQQTGGDRVEDAENRDNPRAQRNLLPHRETAADGETALYGSGGQAGGGSSSVHGGEGGSSQQSTGAGQDETCREEVNSCVVVEICHDVLCCHPAWCINQRCISS